MRTVELICLANSRKTHNHCVAGIRTDGSGWLRPVSNLPGGDLTTQQCQLSNGTLPAPLDVVRMEVVQHRPQAHQPENWLIGGDRWELVRQIDPVDAYALVRPAISSGTAIFGNLLDRVPQSAFAEHPINSSLMLIEPTDIQWIVTTNHAGNRRTRCSFTHAGHHYNFVVTDPSIEARTSGLALGNYRSRELGFAARTRQLLCLSLGEPLYGNYVHGDCFKLVAGVVTVPAHR